MAKFDNPLANIKIASPCSADWNAMKGDERKRFCGECKLSVYNLSGMTKYDAENMLRLSEGRLCVRYFQRPDGTVLTKDCPVGWAVVKRRVSAVAAAAFALFVAMFGSLLALSFFGRKIDIGKKIPIPFATPTPQPLMGAVALPTPKAKPSPSATPKKKMDEFMGRPVRESDEIRREVEKAAGV